MKKVTPKSECVSARYTNYFRVGHNAVEFVLEFGVAYDEGSESLHTHLIISPAYATDLSEVLRKSLKEHEARYGHITGAGTLGGGPEPGDA
jgi:hypothetical protein